MRLGARIIGTFNMHPPCKSSLEWRMIWFPALGAGLEILPPQNHHARCSTLCDARPQRGILALGRRIAAFNLVCKFHARASLCYLFFQCRQNHIKEPCTLQALQLKCILRLARDIKVACMHASLYARGVHQQRRALCV
jgi:hypothetical protein